MEKNSRYILKIPIKNIYHMLSYAYNMLKTDGFAYLANEDFENIYELLSEVLILGIGRLIKQGIYQEYISYSDDINVIRGKVDLSSSIKLKSKYSMKISCTFDEFSSNNMYNNIIKSTCISLIGNNDIGLEKRKKIKRYMAYFNEAECIDLNQINWNKIKFSRNNLIYKMIIDICFLLNNGLIVNEEDGKYKFTAYLKDRQMAKLYEKFIYEFYKKECPHLKVKYQETIRWKSDDGNIGMLPNMSTDISLEDKEKKLIIDTKFYSQCLQKNYISNKSTFISGNIYQIFAYVKNSIFNGQVSGMLLYPTVEYDAAYDYILSGNKVSIRTVDLNKDFREIRESLIKIIDI